MHNAMKEFATLTEAVAFFIATDAIESRLRRLLDALRKISPKPASEFYFDALRPLMAANNLTLAEAVARLGFPGAVNENMVMFCAPGKLVKAHAARIEHCDYFFQPGRSPKSHLPTYPTSFRLPRFSMIGPTGERLANLYATLASAIPEGRSLTLDVEHDANCPLAAGNAEADCTCQTVDVTAHVRQTH